MKKCLLLTLMVASTAGAYARIPDMTPGIHLIDAPKSMSMEGPKTQVSNLGDDFFPKTLLQMGETKHKSLSMSANEDLTKNLAEIKTSEKFHPLPTKYNVIGYAPSGGYKDGWTGIISYFKSPNVNGVCTYERVRSIAVQLLKQNISKEINGKYTITYDEGNINSGYLYTVTWYHEDAKSLIRQSIDCASYNKDSKILPEMVKIAKELDQLT